VDNWAYPHFVLTFLAALLIRLKKGLNETRNPEPFLKVLDFIVELVYIMVGLIML
jgi:hypothetical protein